VSVEDEMSTPRYMLAEVPQGSVLSPTLYNLYNNDTAQISSVNLDLFADDTCLYATDRQQWGLCFEKDPAWAILYGGLV
jgi:hypothetical protein